MVQQFFAIPQQPGTVFNDASDGGTIQVVQGFLVHQGSDQACIKLMGFRITIHPVVKVHGNLEQLIELGIVQGEQVIDVWLTKKDNLDIQRNRFRLQ